MVKAHGYSGWMMGFCLGFFLHLGKWVNVEMAICTLVVHTHWNLLLLYHQIPGNSRYWLLSMVETQMYHDQINAWELKILAPFYGDNTNVP